MHAPRSVIRHLAAALGVTLAGLAGTAAAQDITPSPAFTGKQLVAPPTDGWYTNGGNIYNQRYSPLTQITQANVADLKAVWRTSLDGSGKNPRDGNQGQILAYDGVIYVETGEIDVFAISVETGKILWTYKPDIDASIARPCCGWSGRGVGMGDGKIFVGRLDAKLTALDQKTGKVVWEIQAEDPAKGYSITSAPLYYDGMVITGYSGSDLGVRGHVDAFDAKTGKLIWRHYTVPAPGEPGSESWPKGTDLWKYGGAAVWQTPAVDPDLGMVYFVTANPGPTLMGNPRPGDNLYTDSIMALDVKTGKMKWYFQQVHHDIWDFDATNPVILFDYKYHGRMRKGIAEAGKTGWIYILDRTNGKPLVGIKEKKVMQSKEAKTSPTQPIPVGDALVPQSIDIPPEGFPLINNGKIYTPYDSKQIAFWAPQGAVNWPPSSYDPRTNRMFVCATDAFWGGKSNPPENLPVPGKGSFAGGQVLRPFGGGADRGIFSAIDLTTNKIVWHQQWTDVCYNPSIATGSGIVFVGRNDGRMTALSSDDGRALWDFQTDGGINAPASTFMYKGTQYLVVFAGGTVSARTKHNDGVWLFSLKGTMGPLPRGSADTAANTPHGPPMIPPTRPANLEHGKKLFTETCASCHGEDGKGSVHGGAPIVDVLNERLIFQLVRNGRNKMPAFGDLYSAGDLKDLAGYVLELNAKLRAEAKK